MKLTLATYGFFVLPMRGERCVGLVAPANAVEDAAHRAEMLIDGVVEASTVPGVSVGRHRTTTIPLERCRLQFGTPDPAVASNFDLILDVSDLFCGGVLDARYASSGHANAVVDFSAGSVMAAADLHTGAQEWNIRDCSGAARAPRRLTSFCVYTRDAWTGRIDLVGVGDNPAAATFLQFSGKDVTLALRNVPMSANASFAQVNRHHTESTKPLLARHTRVNDAFTKRPETATDVPRASVGAHIASFLGLEPYPATDRRVPDRDGLGEITLPPPPPAPFEGDPHCSMRKAQVPTKKRGEHLGDLVPPVIPRRA